MKKNYTMYQYVWATSLAFTIASCGTPGDDQDLLEQTDILAQDAITLTKSKDATLEELNKRVATLENNKATQKSQKTEKLQKADENKAAEHPKGNKAAKKPEEEILKTEETIEAAIQKLEDELIAATQQNQAAQKEYDHTPEVRQDKRNQLKNAQRKVTHAQTQLGNAKKRQAKEHAQNQLTQMETALDKLNPLAEQIKNKDQARQILEACKTKEATIKEKLNNTKKELESLKKK